MNIKEKIGNRIKESRKAAGLTIKELAEKTNELSPARIGNWEQGTRSPGPVEAKILAEHLNVSASYLLCLTNSPQGELTRSANFGMRHIPVLSMKDAHHYKEVLDESDYSHEKTIVIDSFNKALNDERLFAVVVNDNSMEPKISAGSIVVVNGGQSSNPGDYVLVYLENKKQIVLRKYGEVDGYFCQLLAINDLWATISVKDENEVSILGVVSEVRQYF
ncbi:LexA family transcriptional regulator [Legionella israelensis]|uniref:helix-turn-helix domain-containing protein n=1 Tax=Legionella israelensis TaxID=454 RepID=UPI001180B506|nr:XRE family transcriptional regulator [Legionella israelensis]QDP72182.1 LexA family transcriptional regulator [Legionella israelensis]